MDMARRRHRFGWDGTSGPLRETDVYEYRARVVRVIDGDTLELTLDVGFRLTLTDHFRLAGLNCPELPTPEGKAAAAFTADWLHAADALDPWPLVVRTERDRREKYGRLLATVLHGGQSLNAALLAAGRAKPARY